ncbi:MarR family transcriptional regulator [Agarivorans sp. QJM3NY_25]|uniref:MarR family transcriptional regulator n=1 Tax=Agarivorans sp. QJM3NY_25 TaxID=3421430 RepID=UPI003D7E5C64
MSTYISDQVQRCLVMIEALAGHEIEGLSPGVLAINLQLSSANVTRMLANLEHAGWIETCPANPKRWRLAHKPVQLANTVRDGLGREQQRLAQDVHNYSIMR